MAADTIKNIPYSLFVQVSDFNVPTVYGRMEFIQWNGSTLNTPYTEGLTTSQIGFAFSYQTADGYATQFAFAVGNDTIYLRTKSTIGWRGWQSIKFPAPS